MQVYAPYGYRKSPADHNILEIEPEGAEVIRRIYRDYAAGKSMNRIVLELNQDKVKTPGAYINDRDNRDYFRNSPKKDSWSTVMVSRILNNEIYGGTLVWHKYHSDATGNAHGGIPYPKDTWERVENAQPALIDEETFLAVRKKLESNSRPKTVHEPHILKGKIYCGNCGYAMGHTYAGRHSYGCYRKYTRTDKDNCVTSIHDSVLEEILLTLIREKMKNRIGMKEIIAGETEARKIKLKTAKSHLKDMELSYEKIDADLFHAYEAYREGISNKETYLQQKEVYEQMLSQMKENMDRQLAAVSAIEEESGIPEGWIKDCEFLEVEKFDRTLVELLIQKVIVSADCGIEVIWNFEN